jgi:aryl-alcohol dehydrogenase-like predicted oxidoreductase
MQFRSLGRSGLKVAPFAFGGNVFGWTADEKTSFELLDRFVERGFNLVDTADVYSRWVPGHGGGESEAIIGRWLKKGAGRRDKIVLATKVGIEMGPDQKGLSAGRIKEAVDASLARLQTERIDLYQAHRDDESVPLEETLEAFDQLIKAGKVRAIGASNYTAPRLAEALKVSAAHGLARFETLQPEYNMVERKGFEDQLAPLCRQQEIGVINYYSLASGFLSGKYRSEADLSKSTRGGKVKAYLNPRGEAILSALDAAASEYQATPAAIALAWLIAQPVITAPIASATSVEQLDQLLKAPEIELDGATIMALNQASAE